MTAKPSDRRLSGRYAKRVWIDVHNQKRKRRVQAADVSRHGLFLEMDEPPEEGRVVLLTIHLPGGPFEAMATVARAVRFSSHGTPGAGVKLYCLASAAKARWDRWLADVAGEAVRARERPSRGAATFLVQLDTLEELRAFFAKHVAARQLVYITPPLKRLGADVVVVLVHPLTHEELSLRGVVEDLDPDRPLRMGVRFEEAGSVVRRRFEAFLEKGAPATSEPLVSGPTGGWTEYAFYSPRLVPNKKDPTLPPQPASDEADPIVVGELLELPELSYVDPKSLFDFDWSADREDEGEA